MHDMYFDRLYLSLVAISTSTWNEAEHFETGSSTSSTSQGSATGSAAGGASTGVSSATGSSSGSATGTSSAAARATSNAAAALQKLGSGIGAVGAAVAAFALL